MSVFLSRLQIELELKSGFKGKKTCSAFVLF